MEQALEIQLLKLGDHDDTATTLNNLGFLLQSQGQLSAARWCHEQALGMRREGHLRESTWAKGEWTDDLLYAVLDHEWQRGG